MASLLSTASLVICALPHSVLIKTTASLTVIVRPLVKCRVASLGLTTQATSGIKPVFTPFFNVLTCRFVFVPSSATFTFLISNLVFFVANLRSQLRPHLTSSAIHHSTAAPGTTPPVLVLPSSWQRSLALVQVHLAWPASAPASIIAPLRPGSSHLV